MQYNSTRVAKAAIVTGDTSLAEEMIDSMFNQVTTHSRNRVSTTPSSSNFPMLLPTPLKIFTIILCSKHAMYTSKNQLLLAAFARRDPKMGTHIPSKSASTELVGGVLKNTVTKYIKFVMISSNLL